MGSFRSGACWIRLISVSVAVVISACGGSGSSGPPLAPPSIGLSDSSLSAGPGGENVSVSVSNEGDGTLNWTAAIPATVTWARISSGGNGSNTGTIQVDVDANTGGAREFDLTVSADGTASRNVTISQPAAPQEIELMAVSTELDGEGGSVTLQVRNSGSGTLEWSASLGADVDWAYIESGESGTDAGEIVVRYALNGGVDRELDVSVSAVSASNSPQSLALSQNWFGTGTCTYPKARGEVLDLLQSHYYFNDEPEQQAKYDGLNLDDFSSLDALLAEIHWMPETHDRGFSYWQTSEEYELLASATYYIFGFRMVAIVNASQQPQYLEVLDVYEGSPAAEPNRLSRGDKILALNGKAVDSLTIQQLQIELGPNEEGYPVEMEVENLAGDRETFTMMKRKVEVPTVPKEHVAVFETDAGRVGYLHFRTFLGNADARLLEEFAEFKSRGIRNLIVDLRYNGGGFVKIAHGLATLIGGPELFENNQQTELAKEIHNSMWSVWNKTAYFDCDVYESAELVRKCESESSLRDLENVVFITSDGSASASELVITALQPYEKVSLVGDRTFGKPVGQYGFGFCPSDRQDPRSPVAILWPVSFATVNSEGFEEYYDGLPVTQGCKAGDDLSRPLGHREEGRIAAALRLIETGSCGTSASTTAIVPTESMQALPPRNPIEQFLGH